MKKNILFNILVFLAMLIFLEVGFSVIFYIKDEKKPLVLSKSTVDFPYVYYTFLPQEKNGSSIVNADGLYTPYNRKKADDAVRIVLIGGSTARAQSASSYESTISAILEKLLQKDFSDINIEVVNAGMSGYVVEQLFIFYQLILSKYNPDIVVGLNGYNDLMSVKLNRYSGIYFAPQNMQQFRVIQQGKGRKTFIGRLSNVFPSIFRMANFIKRRISKQSQYDYSTFNPGEIKKATSDYINIIKDIHSFCKIKGVIHIEFLQPIRWYIKGDKKAGIEKKGSFELIDLYSSYEKSLTEIDYGYSLTDLFNTRGELFSDDCHFFDAGNELIARRMLIPVKKSIEKIIKGGR